MNNEANKQELIELFGEFMMTFGSLETLTIHAILIIAHVFHLENQKKNKFFEYILDNNSFEQNFAILRNLIKNYTSKKVKDDWNAFSKDIEKLRDDRNTIYAHGYIHINGNAIEKKIRKKGWKTLSIETLKTSCELLKERYKQLSHSLIDSMFDDKWTCKFPKLSTENCF